MESVHCAAKSPGTFWILNLLNLFEIGIHLALPFYMKRFFLLLLLFAQLAVADENSCQKIIQSFFEDRTSRQVQLEKQDWIDLGEDNSGLSLIGAKEINDYLTNLIKHAKESIELQTLIMYQKDWPELLILKAKEGVRVHVQVSTVEYVNYSPEQKNEALRLLARMRESGITVDEFDRLELRRRTEVYSPDMHKKMLITDGKYGYVGNKNLTPHSDSIEFGMALKGPSVRDLRSLFFKDIGNSLKEVKYLDEVLKIGRHSNIHFLNSFELKKNLIEAIHASKKTITLGQVEFSDDDVVRALIEKKKKSPQVDIRIITMNNSRSYSLGPVKIKRAFNIEAIKNLQANGIDVYIMDESKAQSNFFHGKITIFDGQKIILGSSDYNTRSFIGNAELDLEIFSPMMASEFESFLKGIANDDVANISFSKTEILLARYFEVIVDLLMKANKLKRKIDKVNPTPEFIQVFIRKVLGSLTQKIISLKKKYEVNFIRDLPKAFDAYAKKIIHNDALDSSPLEADEFYVFVGTNNYVAMRAKKDGLEKTLNGYFGNGYYFANNIQTAIRYSRLRARQLGMKGASDILIFKVKKMAMNHFILNENNSDKNSALLIEAAEGLKHDYLILQDQDQFKLVRHLQITN